MVHRSSHAQHPALIHPAASPYGSRSSPTQKWMPDCASSLSRPMACVNVGRRAAAGYRRARAPKVQQPAAAQLHSFQTSAAAPVLQLCLTTIDCFPPTCRRMVSSRCEGVACAAMVRSAAGRDASRGTIAILSNDRYATCIAAIRCLQAVQSSQEGSPCPVGTHPSPQRAPPRRPMHAAAGSRPAPRGTAAGWG